MTDGAARVHVTTTDISLELLLGPQLEAFAQRGLRRRRCVGAGPVRVALAERGIEHVPLGHATRSMAPPTTRAPSASCRAVPAAAPTIVHTHNPKPGVYGRIAARLARLPASSTRCTVSTPSPTTRWPSGRRSTGSSASRPRSRTRSSCRTRKIWRCLRRLRVPDAGSSCSATASTSQRFDPGRSPRTTRAGVRRELGAGAARRRRGRLGRPARGREGLPRAVRGGRAPCPSSRPRRGHRGRRAREGRRAERGRDRRGRSRPACASSAVGRRRPSLRRAWTSSCSPRTARASPARRWKRRRWACRSSPPTSAAAGRWSTTA